MIIYNQNFTMGKFTNCNIICYSNHRALTVLHILAMVFGALLTLATRPLQHAPQNWHHSATVALAFALVLIPLVLYHLVVLYNIKDRINYLPQLKRYFRDLGIFSAVVILS